MEQEASRQVGVIPIPFAFRNGLSGSSYGFELAADVNPRDWWHMGASYSYLRLDLRPSRA